MQQGLVPTTVGLIRPLTFERYRICELYAELLHCSNMSLLNRCSEHDHIYDNEGRLQGGLAALETLARVIALGSSDEREREPSDEPRDEVEPALELPVTNPSRTSSLLDSDDDMSDDPGSSDDDAMEEIVMDDESPKGHFRSGDDCPAESSQTTMDSPPCSSSSPSLEPATQVACQRCPISPSRGSSQATATPSRQNSRRSTYLSATPEIPVGERMKQCFLDSSVLSTLLVGILPPCAFRPSDLVRCRTCSLNTLGTTFYIALFTISSTKSSLAELMAV